MNCNLYFDNNCNYVYLLQKNTDTLNKYCRSRKINGLILTVDHSFKPLDTAVKYITDEEENELLRLYYTYEFSDIFTVINSNNRTIPLLCNFVESGIISEEEMYMAMFM